MSRVFILHYLRAKAATDAAFIETQLAAQVQTWEDELALTGRTTNRNGKYAANGLVTHAFGEGTFLRGFSLGGNFRWRSASIIGYERKTNAAGRPLAVIDVNRPLGGEDYWELGFMVSRQFRFANRHQVKLQLNVDNPFNWDDPRVVASEYDSQGYYGTVDSIGQPNGVWLWGLGSRGECVRGFRHALKRAREKCRPERHQLFIIQ